MKPKGKSGGRNGTSTFSGPEFATIEDAVVRIPGRDAELMRLAMMHEPTCAGVSFKAMAGALCRIWAESIIEKRGVRIPDHLRTSSDLEIKKNGGGK